MRAQVTRSKDTAQYAAYRKKAVLASGNIFHMKRLWMLNRPRPTIPGVMLHPDF